MPLCTIRREGPVLEKSSQLQTIGLAARDSRWPRAAQSASICLFLVRSHLPAPRWHAGHRRHTTSRSRRAFAPELCLESHRPHGEGRGECRVPNAPAASCALGVVEYAHEYSQRRHRKHPAFPTQWFYGLLRALPGDQALLTPSSARRVGVVANLAPASGRQNHTASPSATASARLTLRRVHRIPPNVRDDRETPLLERRDGDSKSQNYEKRKRFFSSRDLDGPISLKGLRKLRRKKFAERCLVSAYGVPHVRKTARRANRDGGLTSCGEPA